MILTVVKTVPLTMGSKTVKPTTLASDKKTSSLSMCFFSICTAEDVARPVIINLVVAQLSVPGSSMSTETSLGADNVCLLNHSTATTVIFQQRVATAVSMQRLTAVSMLDLDHREFSLLT